ncbi:MAG TPA: hypothetical protein DCY88_14310 [Cyanobacteria bacterium UBA11372]|nr:hypothetical protein [Cyanobacteria bacterium UBA11372]
MLIYNKHQKVKASTHSLRNLGVLALAPTLDGDKNDYGLQRPSEQLGYQLNSGQRSTTRAFTR